MPAYEAEGFAPPAPVVRARLIGPSAQTIDGVPLLIDTGADVSVVPFEAALAVGTQPRPATVPIQFYGGEQTAYQEAEVTIAFLRYRFRGVFLVADAEYGIPGRSILNLLTLSLDGPALEWFA